MRASRTISTISGPLLAAVAVAAIPAASAAAATLDVTSGVPTFTAVDLGPRGASLGDANVFEAPITGGGQLLGVQTTIGAGPRALTVQGALSFDLPDGQLAVAGVSQIDPKPVGLLPGRPYVRAVVGGSGRYAGMRGTVTSTRRADGTYDQGFALQPPAGGTRTVSVVSTSGPGKQVDLPDTGNSPGDLTLVDDAVLRDAQDAIVGTVRGVQQVVSTTGGRVVQAQLTYRLADGEILVGGISRQVTDGTGLVVGTTFVRPVLGGTGAYAGAGGTMTTTLDAGGRYAQRFDLSGVGAPVTRTVRLVGDDDAGRTSRNDAAPAGVSPGDQTAFAGPLRDARGKRRVGTARGVQTTVAVEDGLQTVASQLTYVVRGRGTLVVGGLSRYPASGTTGTIRGALPDRPVIGGTGDFAGAHGVLRTVRTRDSSYRLTFSLSGAPSRKR
jgi:hypothetical protein